MTASAIAVHGVGKRYVKYQDAPLLITALRVRARTKRSQFWALRDASFSVDPGESVGIIGRNGSGKSTLLRLLAGVTAPTEGSVQVHGRVAPLISVGVGFHPELTGRENVYVNATVLGLSRRQIDQRFDAIVDFAELPTFIDTPVKFYSSGMFVRLGFAVAAHCEPAVLLVDEVLAVGDTAFQLKCYERMNELKAAGATIVVVSHNLAAIRQLCPRTIVLHDGDVRFDGPSGGAIEMYHALLGQTGTADGRASAFGDGAFCTVEAFELLRADGTPTLNIETGEDVMFRVSVRFQRGVINPVFGLAVFTAAGIQVYGETSPWAGGSFANGERAHFDVRMAPRLASGSYTAQAGVRIAEAAQEQSVSSPPLVFYASGRPGVNGIADLEARTSLVRCDEPAQQRASQKE